MLVISIVRYTVKHIYTHEHIQLIHTYTHAYIHTWMHAYIHVYIRTYIHTYIHTYIYIRTYIRTHIHAYLHMYIIHTYVYTHTHIHRYTYVYSLLTSRYRCDSPPCDVSSFVTSNLQTYGISGLQGQIKTVTFCRRLILYVSRRNAKWRIIF